MRGDFRRPELSRFLASYLPPGYFCALDDDNTCLADQNGRYAAYGDVELRGQRFAGGVSANYVRAPSAAAPRRAARGAPRSSAQKNWSQAELRHR